jgi:hypothetical protein
VAPYFLGSGVDTGYDDSEAAAENGAGAGPANDGSDGYEGEPQGQYADQYPNQQAPLAPYPPNSDWSQPVPAPTREEAVTLIFKDGRPPEQIHNYLLTRTTLFVGDQGRRAIPTDQLDLVATAKVNQDAGVDFQLPNALK